jgi:hypothetical protein
VSGAQHITEKPLSDIPPEQARDARARVWAYVFECYSRREMQKGGPTTSRPDDAKEIKNGSRHHHRST